MKILFVSHEYAPVGGGVGVALSHLVHELGSLHDVVVLTSGAPGLPTIEKQQGATIHRVHTFGRRRPGGGSILSMYSFLFAGLRGGKRILREERFNLINTWSAVLSGLTGVRLSKKAQIPHVLTLLGEDVYDPSGRSSAHRNVFFRSVVRRAMEASHRVTACSSDVRDRGKAIFPREISIDVVPLAIAPPRYRPADRLLLGLDRDAFYCITIGPLVLRKRLGLLLDLLVRSSDPKTKLLIVGQGPEEKSLRRHAEKIGLGKRVEFLGPLPDEKKFQYLANCDAYVSVSLHEGFGLALLEAMACGLPVLAPVMGGQRDYLIHGKTGLVLEPDGEDLLRRINELLDAPEKAIEMRESSRRQAESFFAPIVAEIWAETFEQYIKEIF